MSKRIIEIKVRLNRKEAEALNKRVKKCGLSREGYLRHLIHGNIPCEAPPADYYAMMQQLYRIGNSMNQVAQKAHVLNVVDVQRYVWKFTDMFGYHQGIKTKHGSLRH